MARSQTVYCLVNDLFMATPAWPTPMRALISKLNLPYAPGRLTDSALFNMWARRAVACISTSPINVLLGALAAGSSADPPPRDTAQTLRDSSPDEVVIVSAPRVVFDWVGCHFCVTD